MAFSVRSETLYGAVSDRNQGVEASYPVTHWGFCASYPCNSELCRIRGLDPQRGHTLAQGYSKDAIELKLLPPTGHFGLLCKTSHQFGRVSDSDQQKEIGLLALGESSKEPVWNADGPVGLLRYSPHHCNCTQTREANPD